MSRHKRGMWSSRPAFVPVEHGGPRVRVGDEVLLFGRDGSCDIVIPDLTVSRRHCKVLWQGDDLVVEDLASSGGTFLNGQRVQRATVRPGDVLRLGPRVEYQAEVEATTTALGLAALREGKEEGVRHLQMLLEVARALNTATVLEEVLEIVLDAAVRLVNADHGYLVLLGGERGRSAVVAHPHGTAEATWAVRSSLLDRVIRERQTIFVGADQKMSDTMIARGIASALATPLVVARRPLTAEKKSSFVGTVEVIGAVLVERQTAGAAFTREELAVFESLASDAAQAIDSARLYRDTREKAKIEHEMTLARTIQSALLREPPRVGFAEFFAYSQPARSVGGDLYFSSVRADDAVALAVGDVSGKGVAAALIMAMVQGLIGMLHDLCMPLNQVLPVLDRNLGRYNPGNRFLTLAMGLVHPSGRLEVANGGHCPVAVLHREGKVDLLPPNGPLLGLIPGARWDTTAGELRAGDVVVFYSDGIPESFSASGREFGQEGLEATLRSLTGRGAEAVARGLLASAAEHREGQEADDDVTLLVARFNG